MLPVFEHTTVVVEMNAGDFDVLTHDAGERGNVGALTQARTHLFRVNRRYGTARHGCEARDRGRPRARELYGRGAQRRCRAWIDVPGIRQ